MNTSPRAAWSELAGEIRALALDAGRQMQQAMALGDHRDVEHKGRVDLVTRVDREVQARLLAAIDAMGPGEIVVAEEGDTHREGRGSHAVEWYVDPIDGTTNFVYGHPFHCVSIARLTRDGTSVGVVYAPALDELFVAEEGRGSWIERVRAGVPPVRLHATECTSLDAALLATGFPYHRGATARLNLSIVGHALTRCRGIRRGGSAALDLCYVGAGRLDGYWELALQPWDVAAGALVAREAGARVTDFLGRDGFLHARRVCAAAPGLHGSLLRLVQDVHARPADAPFGAPPDRPVPLEGPLPTELEDA